MTRADSWSHHPTENSADGCDQGFDGPFDDAELQAALQDLNGSAAVGPQGVPSWVLKEVFQETLARPALLALMNQCWSSGTIPAAWSHSELFVLYKGKGDDKDPNNYRGINLLNDFYRIYERMIEQRLSKWRDQNDLHGDFQFGFRRHRSTVDACFLLRGLAQWFADRYQIPFYVVFVDLAKAFPSLHRQQFIYLLREKKCPPHLLNAVIACFQNNTCSLRFGQFISDNFGINVGAREGGITSPGNFNSAYGEAIRATGFDVLPEDSSDLRLGAVYVLAFADDLATLSSSPVAIMAKLQQFSEKIQHFGMRINIPKTKTMCFLPQTSQAMVPQPILFQGIELERVSTFKYLGFNITADRQWLTHRNTCQSRAVTAGSLIGGLMSRLQVSDLERLRIFFLAMVASQLHGKELLGFSSEAHEDLIHHFLRQSFMLPTGYPKAVAILLLAIPPLKW